MRYEILYLIGEPNTAQLETINKTIEDHLVSRGAVLSEEKWEHRRKLAYPIKHITRGTYIARRFEIHEQEESLKNQEGEPIDMIRKQLNLMPEVLRHIIVKADELPSLKEFMSKKEEEKLRHAQEPKSTTTRGGSRRFERKEEERKPISSQPFAPIKNKEKEPVKEKEVPEVVTPKKSAPISDDTTKKIDEKLDEILNM